MKNLIIFVDVDTQHDFMDEKGALPVEGAPAIHATLRDLTGLAKQHDIPVLSTLDTHRPDDPEFSRFPPHCIKGSPGWKKIGVTADAKGECFEKDTFDIFTNPAFAERVKAIGPRIAVVYGVATDYCVKAAVMGLLSIVPRVIVVEDAIRALDPATGGSALEAMKADGALIMTSDRIQAMLVEDGC